MAPGYSRASVALAGFCCWGDTSPNAGDDHLGPRALRGPTGHLPAWHWLLPRSSGMAWAKQHPAPRRRPHYLPPLNGCREEHHFSFLLKFSMHTHRAQKSGSPAVLSANAKTGKSCLPPGFTLFNSPCAIQASAPRLFFVQPEGLDSDWEEYYGLEGAGSSPWPPGLYF